MHVGAANILDDRPVSVGWTTLKALQADNGIVLLSMSFVEHLTQAIQKQRRPVCLFSSGLFWCERKVKYQLSPSGGELVHRAVKGDNFLCLGSLFLVFRKGFYKLTLF